MAEKSIKILNSLPMGALFAGPMKAAVEAHAVSARTTVEYIQFFGVKPPETDEPQADSSPSPSEQDASIGELRYLEFKFTRQDADGVDQKRTLSFPLLSMIPIPVLSIETLDIDFSIRIEETYEEISQTKSASEEAGETGDSGGSWTGYDHRRYWNGGHDAWWGGNNNNYHHNSKYVHRNSNSNLAKTDLQVSSSIDVKIRATSEAMPLGLSKLVTLLESLIVENEQKTT